MMAVSKDFKEQVEKDRMSQYGWKLLSPSKHIPTAEEYKDFIEYSSAEFSVAKNAYVKSNSGWFSCRSACYLAAGRPVITQETGWSQFVAAGRGLFSFQDLQSAVEHIHEVAENWKYHSIAAVDIAWEYFDSGKVLNQLLNSVN